MPANRAVKELLRLAPKHTRVIPDRETAEGGIHGVLFHNKDLYCIRRGGMARVIAPLPPEP